MTTYVLASGCFWCLDAVMQRLKGVISSECGYAGGDEDDAHYQKVATGMTGHAEAVRVTFDETVIPPETLLDIFFLTHNPTTKDCQGNDIGPQYRSAMFYVDDVQKQAFEAAIDRVQAHWDDPIVTELTQLDRFYPAESEHQDFYTNNPTNGYCNVVVAPKVAKARRAYVAWFKEDDGE